MPPKPPTQLQILALIPPGLSIVPQFDSRVLKNSKSYGSKNSHTLRLQLHGAIYRPDSFVLMLSYCANLKAIIYESTSLNRIVFVADKSHRVIVALHSLPLNCAIHYIFSVCVCGGGGGGRRAVVVDGVRGNSER